MIKISRREYNSCEQIPLKIHTVTIIKSNQKDLLKYNKRIIEYPSFLNGQVITENKKNNQVKPKYRVNEPNKHLHI